MIHQESSGPTEHVLLYDKFAPLVSRQAEQDMEHFLMEQHSFQEMMMEAIRYQQLADEIQFDSCKVSSSLQVYLKKIIYFFILFFLYRCGISMIFLSFLLWLVLHVHYFQAFHRSSLWIQAQVSFYNIKCLFIILICHHICIFFISLVNQMQYRGDIHVCAWRVTTLQASLRGQIEFPEWFSEQD